MSQAKQAEMCGHTVAHTLSCLQVVKITSRRPKKKTLAVNVVKLIVIKGLSPRKQKIHFCLHDCIVHMVYMIMPLRG